MSSRLKPVASGAARAPEHLDPATAAWWERVLRDWDLDDHHVRLLTLAAESWDRGKRAAYGDDWDAGFDAPEPPHCETLGGY